MAPAGEGECIWKVGAAWKEQLYKTRRSRSSCEEAAVKEDRARKSQV